MQSPAVPVIPASEKKRLIDAYIAFRSNPANDRFDDSKFCSQVGISVFTLERLKTPDIYNTIDAKGLTDQQLTLSIDRLLRLVHTKSLQSTVPVKSLEGLINAYTNLLKQKRVDEGKPTEYIAYEEMRKMPTADRHRLILSRLGSFSNN